MRIVSPHAAPGLKAGGRAPTRRGRRGDRSRLPFILGCLAAMGLLFAGGALGPRILQSGLFQPPPALSAPWNAVGTVTLAPRQGDQCWQLGLDNRTGTLFDLGNVPCDSVGQSEDSAAQEAASRLDGIRNSFMRR